MDTEWCIVCDNKIGFINDLESAFCSSECYSLAHRQAESMKPIKTNKKSDHQVRDSSKSNSETLLKGYPFQNLPNSTPSLGSSSSTSSDSSYSNSSQKISRFSFEGYGSKYHNTLLCPDQSSSPLSNTSQPRCFHSNSNPKPFMYSHLSIKFHQNHSSH